MSDKYIKRIKQYLEDLIEERDDLFKNIGKLINTAQFQVQIISGSQASLSENEVLLTFIKKMLVLFSELNHSVLKCIETANIPISEEPTTHSVQHDNVCSSNSQELHDYFKEDPVAMGQDTTSFNVSQDGPKIPNDQAQNDSYVRKPLDDTTLKVICKTLLNQGNSSGDAMQPESTSCEIKNNSANPPVSPTLSCSESDVFSTISTSTYQHPLMKFRPPTEIPKQYDSKDLEKVKMNMIYLSRKMGFGSEEFAQMTTQFNKASPLGNFQYEEPVKDVQNEGPKMIEKDNPVGTELPNMTILVEKPEKLNNETLPLQADTHLLSNEKIEGPSEHTGAVRKKKLTQEDLIEFSASNSGSESSDKVASWLCKSQEGEKQLKSAAVGPSETVDKIECSAVEKLTRIKRYDRNEEAREKARADMPDLRLVPVETPQVIKNDLNSAGSSPEKPNKNGGTRKPKVNELNKEICMYEIQKMDTNVGAVCVFSHIISPSEFYLQIVNDSSTNLDLISRDLEEKFSKTESKLRSKQDAFARLGKFCCGYIWGERKSWYRLCVLDWKLGCASDEVEVQSVDYGFRCTTMYTYLRELTVDLAKLPMQAIKCHFPMIYPPGSTYTNRLTEWSPSTAEALYDIANLSRDITQLPNDITLFEIVFVKEDGDSLAVDLVQYLEPDTCSLSQLLIEMGLAKEIMDDYESDPALAEFLEDIDELERADNLNEFLVGYDAKDEARVCWYTRKDGTCYKGKHCKLEHIQLKDGYTTDRTPIFYTAINSLILPCKGETVQVLVTAYVDSCRYLVQIVRNPVKKENTNLVMDKDISDLIDAMNHPKLAAKFVPCKIDPAAGQMVLAYHPIYKNWMRVAVRDLNSRTDGMMEVYSVDFGEDFLVNIKNVRLMQEEFMHVPFQIIQIYLDNYQHRNNCDAKKARRFFDKHIAYKTFLAHIRSDEIPYKVNLTTFKGREIGPTLVKEGFAEKRSIDVNISEEKHCRNNLDLE